MPVIQKINFFGAVSAVLFLLPLLTGAIMKLTPERALSALRRLFGAALLALSAGAAVLSAALMLSDAGTPALARVFGKSSGTGPRDVLGAVLLSLAVLFVLDGALRLAAAPFANRAAGFLSRVLSGALNRAGGAAVRLYGALWQLPKAVSLVLLSAFLCYAYTGLSGNTAFGAYLDRSGVYRFLEKTAVEPVMRSPLARRLPDELDKAAAQVANSLSPEGKHLFVTVFINGETVGEAVQSCPDIDNTALDLTDGLTDGRDRAKALYDWVCANISYDDRKAALVTSDPFAEPSGAVPAFETRSGVCFDKACLYAAMCRAAHVPVRLITGQALGTDGWAGHSWNEIYDEKAGSWVSVDVTFGESGENCFGNTNFGDDHKDAFVQGEWR